MRVVINRILALSLFLLVVGFFTLIASVCADSVTAAFVGLGLTFWGITFLYIRTEEYLKKSLVNALLPTSLAALEQAIRELAYKGEPVYLPPKYFDNPETVKIYIPKQSNAVLPDIGQIPNGEDRLLIKASQGIFLTPPGAQLVELLEKTLRTSFIKVDVEYLRQNLPKLLMEELDLAENVEIQVIDGETEKDAGTPISSEATSKNKILRAKITNSTIENVSMQASEESQLKSLIGCPVCSAIATALAKASGKPVKVEQIKSEDGKTVEVDYRIIED